jgi:hypothetical protein
VFFINFFSKGVSAILYFLVIHFFFDNTKKCIFPLKFLYFLAPIQIRDPDSQYGSGSTKSLNPGSGSTTLPKTTKCNKKVSKIQSRVAKLGDFYPKNENLGNFLAFGELGDFRGILKVSYNRASPVK